MPKYDPEVYKRYACVVSPSTLATYLTCPRKAWFSKVLRMPELAERKKLLSRAMGNVGHAVLERYLLADDTGRGPDGKAVDLYPDGWHVDDPVVLTHVEQAEIRAAIEHMIDSGTVVRRPGRLVEEPFTIVVDEEKGLVIHGVLDVTHPEGVEDHKFSKSKKWISTVKDLANDIKMICYAVDHIARFGSQSVWLRLNYGIRGATFTKPVDVEVSREGVMRYFHETIVPAAEGVLELKRAGLSVDEWRDVTGPQQQGACQKYGGCPFATVCSGEETPQEFQNRIRLLNQETQDGKLDLRSQAQEGSRYALPARRKSGKPGRVQGRRSRYGR